MDWPCYDCHRLYRQPDRFCIFWIQYTRIFLGPHHDCSDSRRDSSAVYAAHCFCKEQKEQKMSEKEMEAIRQTYDKLDEFLYEKGEKRSRRRAKNHPYQTGKVHKLMKSRTDKRISGVCGGLAKYLGINSTLVRILFVTGAFLGSGLLIFLYI